MKDYWVKKCIIKIFEIQDLYNTIYCSCDDGVIICPGCNGQKESMFGKCAGCIGKGIVMCGKCGRLNEIKIISY